MPTKVIRDPAHVDALANILRGRNLPITVTWTQGATRSDAQNRLAQRWFSDIATQLGDRSHEDVRAECKLTIGVPILRAENEAFRLSYDKTMKRLPYEAKLEAIKAFDLPVSRLMTTRQMHKFMEEIHKRFSMTGIRLTNPEELSREEGWGK